MADNVQPDAGEEREVSSSGLLLSAEPLQDSTGYRLGASGDTVPSADSEADDVNFDSDEDGDGDSDNGDDDSDADGGGPLVVEVGGGASAGDSDNGDDSDSDKGDDSDAVDSDDSDS